MTELENTRIIEDAYAAFSRGDVPGILSNVADDVDWHGVIGAAATVPTRGKRRGRQEVDRFFQQVGESVEFKKFEPREFLAKGDKVVTLGYYEGRSKKTGKTFQSDFVMVFTLKGGKVVQFREYLDAENINAAF